MKKFVFFCFKSAVVFSKYISDAVGVKTFSGVLYMCNYYYSFRLIGL